MTEFSLKKVNKRLWIYKGLDKFYSPPEFIRIRLPSRQPMIDLVNGLNQSNDHFGEIFKFESSFSLQS